MLFSGKNIHKKLCDYILYIEQRTQLVFLVNKIVKLKQVKGDQ